MYNSHNYTQMQRGTQNRYINNRLSNEYNKIINNNVPYTQNPLLSNNPNFVANIRNSDFYTRMNLEKMEQMRKIKDVKDLGITERQLTDYIICPIVVAKEDKKELDKKNKERENNYLFFGKDKFGKDNEYSNDNIPEFIKMLWSGRSNNPYKNILKKEDYNKSFKKKDDLVVHKVTKLDKNIIKTLKDFENMKEFIVLHNGELKIKFSKKKENKYKEKFDYINKVKYSFKFDPKNFSELKQFYKQEQKKIKRTDKRINEMLEILLASESLSKEDIDDINIQYNKNDEQEDLSYQLKLTTSKIDKKFEKELEEELGLSGCDLNKMLEEELEKSKNIDKKLRDHKKLKKNKSDSEKSNSPKKSKKVTKVIKYDNNSEKSNSPKNNKKITIKKVDDNKNDIETKKPIISIKPKMDKSMDKSTDNSIDNSTKKKLVTIIKPKEQNEKNKLGYVDDDLLAKYRDKQKKAKNKQDD